MNGILYIVATPIGNLGDITLRAIEILGSVEVLLCEDTRHTGLLLAKYNIKKAKLISYNEFNELQKTPEIINLLNMGKNVALVSDAGTPLISDPGFVIVREAIRRNIKVIPIPGPTAVITALSVSGLPVHNFYFGGYLPKENGKRTKILENLPKSTCIFYESPHRLRQSLENMKMVKGDIPIVVCRELTKIHEEILRGTISEALTHFPNPKGEFVILF